MRQRLLWSVDIFDKKGPRLCGKALFVFHVWLGTKEFPGCRLLCGLFEAPYYRMMEFVRRKGFGHVVGSS